MNVFYGYSDVRYLNDINLNEAKQNETAINVWRANAFFEYTLTQRRKAHIIWGIGCDQSGYANNNVTGSSKQIYRQYYLYLPVAFKYKWTKSLYSTIGMAGGSLIESRRISVSDDGKKRINFNDGFYEFQLSSTLSLGYELPLSEKHVFFFEAAGNYHWLGKLTSEAAKHNTHRSPWQVGLGIGIMKRF